MTATWDVPDPERLIDLTRRLSSTDSFTDTLSVWSGEPVRLRLALCHPVARDLSEDVAERLGVVDVPLLRRLGTLAGVRSGRPLAEVSSTVAVGHLPPAMRAEVLGTLDRVPWVPLGRVLREAVPDLERHTVRVAPVSRSDLAGESQCLGVEATLLSRALGVTLAVVREYVYTRTVNDRRG